MCLQYGCKMEKKKITTQGEIGKQEMILVPTPLISKHAANKLPEIRRFAISTTMFKWNSFHSYC